MFVTGAYTRSRSTVATWTARMRKTDLKTTVDRMLNLEMMEALICETNRFTSVYPLSNSRSIVTKCFMGMFVIDFSSLPDLFNTIIFTV